MFIVHQGSDTGPAVHGQPAWTGHGGWSPGSGVNGFCPAASRRVSHCCCSEVFSEKSGTFRRICREEEELHLKKDNSVRGNVVCKLMQCLMELFHQVLRSSLPEFNHREVLRTFQKQKMLLLVILAFLCWGVMRNCCNMWHMKGFKISPVLQILFITQCV